MTKESYIQYAKVLEKNIAFMKMRIELQRNNPNLHGRKYYPVDVEMEKIKLDLCKKRIETL